MSRAVAGRRVSARGTSYWRVEQRGSSGQRIAQAVAQPFGVVFDGGAKGFEEAFALLEEAVAGAGAKVAAGLGVFEIELVETDFRGAIFIAFAVVE